MKYDGNPAHAVGNELPDENVIIRYEDEELAGMSVQCASKK